MKLHLPKGLLVAVLAVVSASSTWAGYEWKGNTENPSNSYSSTDWSNSAYWDITGNWGTNGAGPGTPDSAMWDAITIEGNGTKDSLTIGAASDRVLFEGWNPKLTVTEGATLYAGFKKFQGDNKWINVSHSSTLDAQIGGYGDGYEGGTLNVSVTDNSNFTLRVNKYVGGDGLIIGWDTTSSVAIVSGNSNTQTINALTLNAGLTDFSSATYSTNDNSLGTIDLNLSITGVAFNAFTLNLGAAFNEMRQVTTEITEANYKGYSNCYYIKQENNGAYTVVFSTYNGNADLTWKGGNLEWSSSSVFDGEQKYSDYARVQFTTADATVTLKEDIAVCDMSIAENVTVDLTGGGHLLNVFQDIDVNGTLQLKDVQLGADTYLTAGTNGKLVIGSEIDMGDALKDFGATVQIADGGKLSLGIMNNSTSFTSEATDSAQIELKGSYVIKEQFENYKGDLIIANGTLVYIGNSANDNGAGTSTFTNVGRVVIEDGGEVWTHTAEADISSDWDLVSGATLGNKDNDKTLSGNIRFNIVDPDAEAATYNANGIVTLMQEWHKTVTLSGKLSGSGTVRMLTPWRESGDGIYKLTNGDNDFNGTYELKDGSSTANDRTLVLELGHEKAAAEAAVALNTSIGTSYLKLDQDSTIRSLSSSALKNTIKADSAATLTVTSGSAGFTGTIGSNVTLNLTGGTFYVTSAGITNNGMIKVGKEAVLNLKDHASYALGNITLNGGSIQSLAGNGDNRNISIESLTGSGSLIGENWNVIWNVANLNGDGDITWENNGTHWAPSVLNINGGTFTGKLTANRITDKQGTRGNYQSVLQINEGGKNTLSGAVVNLDGKGATGYVQMALNTDQVAIGGLEGTQYSHIYAGKANTEGGGDSNSLCDDGLASSTGSAILKLNSDENHDFKGSVANGISIQKAGSGKQTFSGDMSAFNGSLKLIAGELAFTAAEALSISKLEMQEGATVSVGAQEKGTLTVNTAATLNGGQVNANLTMASGSSVTIQNTVQMGDSAQESQMALTGDSSSSGYTLTLNEGLTLNIEPDKGDMRAPGSGEILLFTGVNTLILGGERYNVDEKTLAASDAVKVGDYFTSNGYGGYYICFNSDGDLYLVIPEPTTTTLSLLALAGLCARRRRK